VRVGRAREALCRRSEKCIEAERETLGADGGDADVLGNWALLRRRVAGRSATTWSIVRGAQAGFNAAASSVTVVGCSLRSLAVLGWRAV